MFGRKGDSPLFKSETHNLGFFSLAIDSSLSFPSKLCEYLDLSLSPLFSLIFVFFSATPPLALPYYLNGSRVPLWNPFQVSLLCGLCRGSFLSVDFLRYRVSFFSGNVPQQEFTIGFTHLNIPFRIRIPFSEVKLGQNFWVLPYCVLPVSGRALSCIGVTLFSPPVCYQRRCEPS